MTSWCLNFMQPAVATLRHRFTKALVEPKANDSKSFQNSVWWTDSLCEQTLFGLKFACITGWGLSEPWQSMASSICRNPLHQYHLLACEDPGIVDVWRKYLQNLSANWLRASRHKQIRLWSTKRLELKDPAGLHKVWNRLGSNAQCIPTNSALHD